MSAVLLWIDLVAPSKAARASTAVTHQLSICQGFCVQSEALLLCAMCIVQLLTQTRCLLQLFLLFLMHAYGGRVRQFRPKILIYMDGPWLCFWPCFIPWVLLQIPVSLAWLGNGELHST